MDGTDFPGPAAPRLFLDLFAGARAPLSAAIATFLADRFEPVDIIFGSEFDLLRDDRFELLCRVADSGIVGAAVAAPVCSDHSVLRLKPGGPPPVRTPSEIDGCLRNSWSAALSAQESSLLHDRTREVLSRVAASGGFIVLENPVSSLTFQDPLMQAWLQSVAPFAAQVAACQVGRPWDKRWLFVSNRAEILEIASVCDHEHLSHEPLPHIPGYRNALADELSRLGSSPPPLALADRCAPPLTELLRAPTQLQLGPPPSAARWPSHLEQLA